MKCYFYYGIPISIYLGGSRLGICRVSPLWTGGWYLGTEREHYQISMSRYLEYYWHVQCTKTGSIYKTGYNVRGDTVYLHTYFTRYLMQAEVGPRSGIPQRLSCYANLGY